MPETSGSTVSVSGGNATVVSSGGSHHITTHVDLPEDDEPDETSESGGIRIVPVPIPIPIPIPIPVSSSGNPDAEEEEDNPDPTLDVHVNK
ncbi:MAG TPA: hypothetical protein PKE31_18805 [Pseudomonadota bacterium]|nr:hypothetical protein [Pseudomonadota bacterium]